MTATLTTWPDVSVVSEWLGGTANIKPSSIGMLGEIVADATAVILDRVDPSKLPVDPDECPRPVARAIILEAARLLSRRESTHGVVAFSEFAVRLANVDVDIEACLRHWGTDPEP